MKASTAYQIVFDYIINRIGENYSDYIVTLALDGRITNELLLLNGDGEFEWYNDWYEGERDVQIIDFFPLEEAVRRK